MKDPELVGGRYELRGLLGRGGMAEVQAGWDVRLERPVAVKLLHRALLTDPEHRARFEFEARSAAALNHPNIVVVHDGGEHRGVPYLVMERLPGASLADAVARGPMPPDAVRAVLIDVLAGLGAAHAAGILHRDVKPANVLFGASGEAKLADFGIAKSGGTDLTRVGQMVGTMAYLSPERIAGRPATPIDDLYAAGVVGYEALTGRMPFPQNEPAALVRAIAEHDLPPLATVRPDVDPVLAGVIDRAMSSDPAQRFGSAEAMRAALLGVRPPTRVMAAPPLPLTGALMPPPPSGRRRKLLALTAGAAAVVLALILVIAEATSSGPGTSVPPTTSSSTSSTTSSAVPVTTSVTWPTTSATTMEPRQRPGNGNGNGPPGRGNEKPKKPKHDD
ncbi:serine/threonine-protein kinase [Mycolicibacterium sp. 624]|uniref:serine/threonine-protein kinase n=1 Tax=Mycolicibacterium sp. 624 TaxID=3156314 RepID=UPI003399E2F4